MQAGKEFVPEILFKGRHYPICGHFFWDNNNGATTLCKSLGFKSGTVYKTRDVYTWDAIPVGNCKPGEELSICTGGGNAYGRPDYHDGYCKKGQGIGVTVICYHGACGMVVG